MTRTARLVGGPAHGRIYAVPDGLDTIEVASTDQTVAALLAEYDPLEAMVDPAYALGLTPMTFSRHLYTRRHHLQVAEHPCVRDLGLAHHRYPWLCQGLDPEDPLIHSWVLSEPVDRVEWIVRDFGRWGDAACSTRPGIAAWLGWAGLAPYLVLLADAPLPEPEGSGVSPDVVLAQRRDQARSAAARAEILYPGPVGEMLARELHVWADFAYRFTEHSLIDQLIDHLLDPTRRVDRREAGRTPDRSD